MIEHGLLVLAAVCGFGQSYGGKLSSPLYRTARIILGCTCVNVIIIIRVVRIVRIVSISIFEQGLSICPFTTAYTVRTSSSFRNLQSGRLWCRDYHRGNHLTTVIRCLLYDNRYKGYIRNLQEQRAAQSIGSSPTIFKTRCVLLT
jgi:hypothetical protein